MFVFDSFILYSECVICRFISVRSMSWLSYLFYNFPFICHIYPPHMYFFIVIFCFYTSHSFHSYSVCFLFIVEILNLKILVAVYSYCMRTQDQQQHATLTHTFHSSKMLTFYSPPSNERLFPTAFSYVSQHAVTVHVNVTSTQLWFFLVFVCWLDNDDRERERRKKLPNAIWGQVGVVTPLPVLVSLHLTAHTHTTDKRIQSLNAEL